MRRPTWYARLIGGGHYFRQDLWASERIFDPRTIVAALSPLRLVSFDAVDDADRMVIDADVARFADARYGCGLFEFAKD